MTSFVEFYCYWFRKNRQTFLQPDFQEIFLEYSYKNKIIKFESDLQFPRIIGYRKFDYK